MSLFTMTGKTALVTGGSRGIGQAMAVGLAEAGADIVLVQRDQTQTATKDAIEALGRRCAITVADLSDRESVKGVISSVTASQRVDILVNVAGIMRRHDAQDYPDHDLDEVMEVNFNCTFLLCRDIGKYWIENKIPGRMINTASLATFQGGVRMAAYSASKGAVGQLTKALSNEWAAHGIRVNAIAPGSSPDQTYYNSITTRIPMGKWGSPDEFKGPVVFLASDASSYITGQIIVVSSREVYLDLSASPRLTAKQVDGGWMAR
ncbi:uncharacterized protein E0L32_007925 [Thyridium curvatum]|uniref:Ketoreductase domain-containing protein n=1 Tax=Thyridium curvatum TaxID=1093900 RepID=A0A507AX84_9PEZI|nr:uncharacterized protein E0L32_007925 [Thyridium curvatum]TPX11064.1 hypothetical protein E0L32_007925 [Thyridium curvatum]